jgi:DNA repair protein RecN (Recombination protein N)
MLSELHITNLALIEKLTLSFSKGLSVLTGETGAGKSIILQAIYLLSGGKASASWVRTGADRATIEALFEVDQEHQSILSLLNDKGFDCDGNIVIKRILSHNGRGRFYINGSLATAKLVSEISENLLSVASQHEHQQLLSPRFQLDFIDIVGDLWQKRLAYSTLYDNWLEVKKEYEKLCSREMDKEQRKDFLTFQVKEISEAQIVPGEDEILIIEKNRLKGADDLNRIGRNNLLKLGEATSILAIIRKEMSQMAELDSSLSTLTEEISGHSYQLEDHQESLRNYLHTIPTDPSELDNILARIDLLQQLKRKYGQDLNEIIAYGTSAGEELEALKSLDIQIEKLHKKLQQLEDKLLKSAAELTALRKETAVKLASSISTELSSLQFEQSLFEIHFNTHGDGVASLTKTGNDRPKFMFSANPGEPVKPLAKIASGGELSRLLLALKCLFARKDQVETVIFDEVDAGISGKAAESVSRKIKELAAHHQVICITHLPQIASYADDHYLVMKSFNGKRTQTTIDRLEPESKVAEIAKMLDGDSVSSQTLAYVRDLVSRNQSIPSQ